MPNISVYLSLLENEITLWVEASTKWSSSDRTKAISLRIRRPSSFEGTRYILLSVPLVVGFHLLTSFPLSPSLSPEKQEHTPVSFMKPWTMYSGQWTRTTHVQYFHESCSHQAIKDRYIQIQHFGVHHNQNALLWMLSLFHARYRIYRIIILIAYSANEAW